MEGNTDSELRFGGIARLYGTAGLQTLQASHVIVVGVGGVGSWAAESLARSGVGKITLVDFDDVCVTNVNRQILALQSTVGQSKVEVLQRRLLDINPDLEVEIILDAFDQATSEDIFSRNPDFLIDAIDSLKAKTLLIAECKKRQLPIVCVGGAGGRRDPSRVKIADLATTEGDRLLQKVRKRLRREYGFSRPINNKNKKFGIRAIYSDEEQVFPTENGDTCALADLGPEDKTPDGGLGCANGFGAVTHVTAVFGLSAAHVCIEVLLAQR